MKTTARGRRVLAAGRHSPLTRTLDMLPRLREWANVTCAPGVHVAKIASASPDVNVATALDWETPVNTVAVDPSTLNAVARGLGRLDGATHRAFAAQRLDDGDGWRIDANGFHDHVADFAAQRRKPLGDAAANPPGHPQETLIAPDDVDTALSAEATTVVWGLAHDDVRLQPGAAVVWLIGCCEEPSYGPYGANLADLVCSLGTGLTQDALSSVVADYNHGVGVGLGDTNPRYLTLSQFAVFLEAAGSGPIGSRAADGETWAALRPAGMDVLVSSGIRDLAERARRRTV